MLFSIVRVAGLCEDKDKLYFIKATCRAKKTPWDITTLRCPPK